MFQRVLAWLREVINKMIGHTTVKQAIGVDIAISQDMALALQTWSLMYANQAEWLTTDVRGLQLPASIAGEISRAVTIEMKAEVSGSARAKYLQAQLDRVVNHLRTQVEYGCAKGGLIIKPYIKAGQVVVDFVQADQFFPIAFDASGRITAIVFADQRQVGDKYYTRLEYHSMTAAGYMIRNLAYRSVNRDTLGNQASLAEVAEWADLLPEAMITNITQPLYGYFRFPLANNIDPTSPLGVSCYARAVDLIQDADEIYQNLVWEFESGKRAIYVDALAFGKDSLNRPILPDKRLYRTLNGSGNVNDEDMFHEWSPEFRDASIKSGLDAVLKRIEYACGLAYGTLSDPATVEKTATEIASGKQRTYATITDTQKALQQALEDLLYAMDVWATLGSLAARGTYSTAFDFDDSIVVDRDAQFKQDLQLVGAGLMGKVEFRMRNFKEDEITARAKIMAITEEENEALNAGYETTPEQ